VYNQDFVSKPIFTGLSPNAQADDVVMAMKLLVMPWRWQKGPSAELLKRALALFLSVKNVFLFESGRSCLYSILNALDLKGHDDVLFQAYTCVAVPEPILWAGAKPVYVDCDEDTLTMSPYDLEKKITANSKVLIIQHTFGQPAHLHRLMEIARKHHLFVIEDCAHSLGSEYDGKLTGSFGDASFFSFGRDKVISSVFGGAVATNDKVLAGKIGQFHASCRNAPKRWILQQLMHPVILSLVKLTYSIFLGKVLLVAAKRLGLISLAVYKQEKCGEKPPFIFCKIPDALAALALHQFGKLKKFNEHRRKIAHLYERGLEGLPLALPGKIKNSQSIFLRYTVRSEKAGMLLKAAKKEQINLGDWYTTALAPEGVDYRKMHYDAASCPVAEKMARETVNLPTDIHIKESDANRIIQFLIKFYGT